MLEIIPSKLNGKISIVSSKSLSHRYVIAAALAEGESIISNILDSDDLVATKEALIGLGATIDGEKIIGTKIKRINKVIDANESGSTLRFLIPIAMLQDEVIEFKGKGKLPTRPLNVYKDMFHHKYYFVQRTKNELPLEVKGPLQSGVYMLHGNISSQFITGLLYALPLVNGDSKIIVTTELESKGYVDLTLDVLKQFGIEIEYKQNVFYIKGNQKYLPLKTSVEGDYSGAAFFIVAGLISNGLILNGLREESLQGDKEIINFAKQMGGKLNFVDGKLVVEKSDTKGITIDIGQTPDLGPILMVLGSLSEGVTTITNASRLRIKESDRLDAMVKNLTKLGVKIEVDGDTAKIYGQKELKGGVTVETFGDHRIAMSMAVAALRCDSPITLDDEKVVSKSYPTFFEEFVRLGGITK
ncbi:3-phosphoshikimate 1-carboxyvinyltransferase [Acholeplasma hippikon]|nr:3-phosphoshikimate 1-carboxyvinyltransferase [Acholeplasma hippikon]